MNCLGFVIFNGRETCKSKTFFIGPVVAGVNGEGVVVDKPCCLDLSVNLQNKVILIFLICMCFIVHIVHVFILFVFILHVHIFILFVFILHVHVFILHCACIYFEKYLFNKYIYLRFVILSPVDMHYHGITINIIF